MHKHSVALILPYFGKFPNYFPLWLKSAGTNSNFTFIIFTDADMSCYNVPVNVQVHSMTLEKIRQRAAKHLGFEPVMTTPYKLCDYKPMFGLIFQDYLTGHDFWGFCDCDMILGDLNKFITDDILDKYGRLYQHGHFQLFRNTEEILRFALHKLPYWNISYKDVYRSSRIMGFDEFVFPKNLFSEFIGEQQYYSPDFVDIYPLSKEFRCFGGAEAIAAFRWKDGKLCMISGDCEDGMGKEYMYIHIQKRHMNFTACLENENSFLIIPNEFVKDHALSQEEICSMMTPDYAYEQEQTAKYGLNFGQGKKFTLIELVSNFCSYSLSDKILSIKMHWNNLCGRKLH